MTQSLPPAPWSSMDQGERNGELFYTIQTPHGDFDVQIAESMTESATQIVKAITALPELLASLSSCYLGLSVLIGTENEALVPMKAALTKTGFTP